MEGVKIIGGEAHAEQSKSEAHHDEVEHHSFAIVHDMQVVEPEEWGHDKLESGRAEYTPPGGETVTETTVSAAEATPGPEFDAAAAATAEPIPEISEPGDATAEQADAGKVLSILFAW